MKYFCTLFDSFYLSRGLAMYKSLERVCSDFHLFIFAFDDQSHSILSSMNLRNVTLIPLSDFENDRLLSVKLNRTKAEYFWTCTSSSIDYVLEKYSIPECTYLDADLYFFSSPEAILSELNIGKTVLITEHRYSWLSKIYEEKRAGKFCVQFVTFKNDDGSRKILQNWIDQCIQWCYDRYEDGKFGDQKYLDDWPVRYQNVKISEDPGAGVAPWNVSKYNVIIEDGTLKGIEKKSKRKFNIIFYHFHFVRFLENDSVDIGWNLITKDAIKHIYYPYLEILGQIENKLTLEFEYYKSPVFKNRTVGIKGITKYLFKKFTRYNILNHKQQSSVPIRIL